VSAGDVVDVEGIFHAINADTDGTQWFQAGICWRNRADGAGVAGPVEGQYYDVDPHDWINAIAIRALSFPIARSIDVGYCARFWTQRTGWGTSPEVKLTVRQLRGVRMLTGSN
jgi:hypothetical protein